MAIPRQKRKFAPLSSRKMRAALYYARQRRLKRLKEQQE